MSIPTGWVRVAARALHQHFFRFLIASYALAAWFPGPGLWIRDLSVGQVTILHESMRLSVPFVLLAFLLFNAGTGIQSSQLRRLSRRPSVLLVGLAANLMIPILFIFGVTLVMRFWHNPEEVQNILVGLALVASMPIAGSSTAWSQNADGDLALSLGLVLGSTLLSPLTTPVALHAVGLLTSGEYAQALHGLASTGTGLFLAVGVILPSLLGITVGCAAGERQIAAAKPVLKQMNSVILLILNYSNASVSLPQAIAQPDPDFLFAILMITLGLCAAAFGAGWTIARVGRLDRGAQAALMFGLGMNNNGTGLVLASLALSGYPRVMLPIIFYNLIQHLVAGAADWWFFRRTRAAVAPPAPPSEKRIHSGSRTLSSSGMNRPSTRIGTPSKAIVPPPYSGR